MKKLTISFVLFIVPLITMAQTNVSGNVVDAESNEPLVGASIIIKDDNGKIIKFTTTKDDGTYTLQLSSAKNGILEVVMMGYKKQSIPLVGVVLPLTIYLEPGLISLKEVVVKADPIREQGDTVSYLVGSFAQKQDRSIGDVLRRMPGIDVAQNGKIQYQGEDINKFYIEGSDLLGGRYGIATNGISHEDVGGKFDVFGPREAVSADPLNIN